MKAITTNPPCPGPCANTRQLRRYLCGDCWFQLRLTTRTALDRRDPMATERLRELYAQVQNGVPLAEIEVTR